MRRAKRSFWSVWRPLLRTSRAWLPPQGILTVRGGMTSHAAVVARGMGTCCVSGCGEIKMDEEAKDFDAGRQRPIKEGDYISIDGSTGNIYGEAIPTVAASISGDFGRFMELGRRRPQR